jgi:hypothetical protein
VGADFAHGCLAGALIRAPHVPRGDSAVRAPAFAEFQEFLRLGHVLFAVGDGPAFFDGKVMDGQNVRPTEAKNQKHFDGPGANSADGDEALDELFVGEGLGLFERGDDAFDGLFGQVFHSGDFCAGEAGFAELAIGELEHFFGRGRASVGAQRFDAGEDGGGRFAGDGLISDGFEQGFVGRLKMVGVGLEGNGVGNEFSELFVAGGEVLHGLLEIERRSANGLSGVFEHGQRGNRLAVFAWGMRTRTCHVIP